MKEFLGKQVTEEEHGMGIAYLLDNNELFYDIGYKVMQNLEENGIIIVVLTLEKYTGQLIAGPDIVTRGFVYVREAEELLDEARAIVSDSVEKCLDKNITDWSKIKNIIKDDLSEYLWKKIKRNPVILPIIMEAQI